MSNVILVTCSPLYSVLKNIKTRCYNTNRAFYPLYGGKGVKVCGEWMRCSNSFIRWGMENGYKKGMYIDRIDPDGDYEPNNCRFVTPLISARNRGANQNKIFKGVTHKKQRNGDVHFRARITVNSRTISLGVYDNEFDAAKAYNDHITSNNLEGYILNNTIKKHG